MQPSKARPATAQNCALCHVPLNYNSLCAPLYSTLLNSCPPIDSLGDQTIPVRIVSELIKNRVEQLQLNCHSSVSTAFGLDWTGVAVKGGTRDVVLEMYQYMHSFKIWHPCIAINILFSYIIISISLQFVYYLTWYRRVYLSLGGCWKGGGGVGQLA